MTEFSRAQARAVDRIAMEDWGIPGIVLMENAAHGIATAISDLHAREKGRVTIVCGPGNNGGDGFATARHLVNRGYDVELQLLAPESAFQPESDSGINLSIARRMGIPMLKGYDLSEARFIVDALFGTGLSRDLREPYPEAVGAINGHGARVLAVDIPSGLDADDGSIHGAAVRAHYTATMVAPKRGFTRGSGPEYTGAVEVIDIGVPQAIVREVAAESA